MLRSAPRAGLLALCLICLEPARSQQPALTRLMESAAAAESASEFDRAVSLYTDALEIDPHHEPALIALKRSRFRAGQAHVNRGFDLRRRGNLIGALEEFEIAAAVDPSSIIATEEAGRIRNSFLHEETAEPALAEAPKLSPDIPPISEITIHNQPVTVVFESLAKQAKLDIIFDPSIQPTGRNFNLHMTNKTIEEALDEAALQTRHFWKPLSANSIFVSPENAQSRHEYEDQVMVAIYLHNMTSPTDLNEIVNVLRTMLDLRRILVYTPQNAVFVRGTPDQVAAARQLIADMDKPKSEVVIDVVVMETSRTRSREISSALSGSAALGIPVTFTPRNPTASSSTAAASSTIPVAGLKRLSSGDFSVALPGLNLALDSSDSQTKILQSPQVRASDGQKASLKIGQRVPYASGSYSAGLGATAQNALVNTQFTYADIGVNVELTPRVHGRDELTLHIDIEISSIADHTDIGGVTEPIIGQRKVGHEVRLREGQATVLAGLTESEDTKVVSGLPGLINVPILRRLFGSDKADRRHSDLLIVLIPHIVRTPDYSPANLRTMFIGSDAAVRVKRQ